MHVSKNSPLLAWPDVQESHQVGKGVFQRLAYHELFRAQVNILQELECLPIYDQLTLVGAAALHGVYLHDRWTPILDFTAPYQIVNQFDEIIRENSIPLEVTKDNRRFYYKAQSHIIPNLTIGVRLYISQNKYCDPAMRPFLTPKDQSVNVLTTSVTELVGIKLGRIFRCQNIRDYLDLWLAIQKIPDLAEDIKSIMADAEWRRYGYMPRPMHIDNAIWKFRKMNSYWYEELAAVIYPVPTYELVSKDLSQWLMQFEGY